MSTEQFSESDVKALRRLTAILSGTEFMTNEQFIAVFEQVIAIILTIKKNLADENDAFRTEISSFKTEIKSENSSDIEEVKKNAQIAIGNALGVMFEEARRRMAAMEAKIDQVENGQDADEELILGRLQALLPTLADLEKNLPSFGKEFRDGLELLQGDERLDISAIKGWEKLRDEIAAAQKTGKPVQFVGGARGIYVYIGGVKKGIMNTLNFAAGTSMSIAYSKVNGIDTLTFNASGGGDTVETPPEVVNPDAGTVLFTVSGRPKYIVADGATYYEGTGYSYSSGTGKITTDIAPSSFIRAIIPTS